MDSLNQRLDGCVERLDALTHRFDELCREDKNTENSVLAYHSSPVQNIEHFHHLTHFGTPKASRDRIKANYASLSDYADKHKKHHIYAARINLGNVHHTKDTGDHDPVEFAHHLHKEGMFNEHEHGSIQNHFTKIYKRHERGKERGPQMVQAHKEAELEQNRHLAGEIRKKGIHTISYKNKFESPGSTSYIITHPSQVQQVKTKVK